MTYRAPTDFSFIYNPQGTISFFSRILSDVTQEKNFGKKIYFDISQIETLTTDALMYLIAIVTNLKRHVMNQYQIYGNRPRASSPRSLFETSGFYRYVEHPQEKDIIPVCENVQILSGEDADPKSAKKLVDFVLEKGQLEKKQCKFLYNMMMELMSNTKNHAYNNRKRVLYPHWYCFADYQRENEMVSFTFMDTGDGIPATVKKRIYEQAGDLFKLNKDSYYVISALKGEQRTETGKGYHGKGLPQVWEACHNGKICGMRIVANRADIEIFGEDLRKQDLEEPLKGTLFYWQIDMVKLKEAV